MTKPPTRPNPALAMTAKPRSSISPPRACPVAPESAANAPVRPVPPPPMAHVEMTTDATRTSLITRKCGTCVRSVTVRVDRRRRSRTACLHQRRSQSCCGRQVRTDAYYRRPRWPSRAIVQQRLDRTGLWHPASAHTSHCERVREGSASYSFGTIWPITRQVDDPSARSFPQSLMAAASAAATEWSLARTLIESSAASARLCATTAPKKWSSPRLSITRLPKFCTACGVNPSSNIVSLQLPGSGRRARVSAEVSGISGAASCAAIAEMVITMLHAPYGVPSS
ncbi:hypothetical protein SAMN04488003_1274 [Loktanella fryxellensis]|uniref:Uncharacterized protein n=1 Tax=Loktanella fryxellensis TaxID=245187 RepID=A0A1H8IQ88_9RHOB|nr:hypothetical protein SAMN04488003_1274 [Loktanella fryxellensis]